MFKLTLQQAKSNRLPEFMTCAAAPEGLRRLGVKTGRVCLSDIFGFYMKYMRVFTQVMMVIIIPFTIPAK